MEQGREIGFSSHNLPLSKSTIAFATEREDTESQYADELRRQAYIQTLGKLIPTLSKSPKFDSQLANCNSHLSLSI